MAWIFLTIAGLLEVAWAACLAASEGFSKFWPSAGFLVLASASFVFLALALKTLPIGTAYAVWTGIGTVGAVIVGILFFKEPAGAARLACIALIVIGIAGLKVLSPH